MSENDKKPPIPWGKIVPMLIVAALLYFHPWSSNDEATKQTIYGTPTEQVQKVEKGAEVPTYSTFIADVTAGKVTDVYMYEGGIGGILVTPKYGKQYKVFSPGDPKLTDQLLAFNVKIHVKATPKQEESSWLTTIFISFGPMILLVAVWIYFMRKMQGGAGGGGMGGVQKVSQTKATRFGPGEIPDRFTDVAGCDEAIGEVNEVLDFMRNPEKYKKLGADIPRGILLDGPPGTGKTLLARAIAGECGAVFYEEKGSSFVEMFVGVGAGRVRDLFDRAEKEGVPTFIFIDEIDALGGSRGGASGGNNGQEHEQTLTELLARMQGFRKSNIPIIIIGATNRPDKLDPALTRPGRFDRKVTLGLPDVEGRYKILLVHTKDKPLAKTVNLKDLARGYIGASGADLKNMANEAAIQAARRNGTVLTMADFEKAKDKIMMGEERKVNLMTEKEKILTAYHEAGHAIVGSLVPGHDPVYKVSIVPRGRALGITMYLPEKERVSATKADLEGMISSVYGGRIAEEIVGGKAGITTGASNDYQRATQLISGMIMQYGLYSDELGHLVFASEYGDHLGTGVRQMAYSDATAQQIDELKKHETHRIYESTKEILLANRDKLEVMKDALMKWETIDKPQIDAVIAGKTLEDEDFPLPKWVTEVDKGTKEEAEENKENSDVDLNKPEGK